MYKIYISILTNILKASFAFEQACWEWYSELQI